MFSTTSQGGIHRGLTINRFLPVKRKAVAVFGDCDIGQQPPLSTSASTTLAEV